MKFDFKLEDIEKTCAKAQGWCHLNKEIALLAQEVIKLREQLARLKKKTKKVIEDE